MRMIRRVNDEEGIKVIFLSLKSRVLSMTHSLGEMYIDADNLMIRMPSKVQRGQGFSFPTCITCITSNTQSVIFYNI